MCIPFDQEQYGAFPDGDEQKCVQCGKKAKSWTLFGRSEWPLGGQVSVLIVRLLSGSGYGWSARQGYGGGVPLGRASLVYEHHHASMIRPPVADYGFLLQPDNCITFDTLLLLLL